MTTLETTAMSEPFRIVRPEIEGVWSEWVDVTPDLARFFLSRNVSNRRIRQFRIDNYAADMKAGDWHTQGAPVQFNKLGEMMDAQHRCLAIIMADVTVKLLVTGGLEPEVMDVLDTGLPRAFSDQLDRKDETHTAALAAILRAVGRWERGERGLDLYTGRHPLTYSQLGHVLERHPELRGIAVLSQRQFGQTGLSPKVYGLCYWLTSSLDLTLADHFFERLASGQGLYSGDPILALRNTLAANKQFGERATMQSRKTALTIKAWNLCRRGASISKMQWVPTGPHAESFPEPV